MIKLIINIKETEKLFKEKNGFIILDRNFIDINIKKKGRRVKDSEEEVSKQIVDKISRQQIYRRIFS